MFHLITQAAQWYWTSGLALWVTLILLVPIATWQIVKRMPQGNPRRRTRRRGKSA